MGKIVELIKEKKGLISLGNVKEEVIHNAETILKTHFADDYKEYVSEFGVASFEDHELTGICISKRLNVVDVTLDERYDEISEDYYVVEKLNIDGIVIWQKKDATIYQTQKGGAPIRIALSLADYLKNETVCDDI
ncbi:MAG: SMI1/KNR4 family protein [Clostridia bacterium]|nr:SMI1/KNR4 family protein [Clostridia bacterium]